MIWGCVRVEEIMHRAAELLDECERRTVRERVELALAEATRTIEIDCSDFDAEWREGAQI